MVHCMVHSLVHPMGHHTVRTVHRVVICSPPKHLREQAVFYLLTKPHTNLLSYVPACLQNLYASKQYYDPVLKKSPVNQLDPVSPALPPRIRQSCCACLYRPDQEFVCEVVYTTCASLGG